jgi:TrmH family RNA methyltransferase
METLTSLQNPRAKQLVALRESRQRKKTGLTRVDGARELLRALESGIEPETVFVREDLEPAGELARALDLCRERGHALQPVTAAVYEKIRYGDRDEGISATIPWTPLSIGQTPAPDDAFWLVVEGVEKPGNLGALLRTADAAGVDAVLLADPACDPSNPNVIRASMGTLFTQPVVRSTTVETIDFLRGHGAAIVTLRPQAERAWHQASLSRGRVAVVSGAEDRGLTAPWREAATEDVVLPMAGHADSLNLAAATAILLYEVVRQRGVQSTAK